MFCRVVSARFRSVPLSLTLVLSELSFNRQGRGAAAASAAARAPFSCAAKTVNTGGNAIADRGRSRLEVADPHIQNTNCGENLSPLDFDPVPVERAHSGAHPLFLQMAEGVGFEPTVGLTQRSISSRVP
jgi:hypothetical protein